MVLSICFIGSVNLPLAGTLLAIALIARRRSCSRWPAAARSGTATMPTKAAAVDGELVDVIGNFNVVRAFGATFREQRRLGERMETEMAARRRSLYYLEHIRLVHAVLTALLTAGVVALGHHPVAERPGQGRRPGADHRRWRSASCTAPATSPWRWSI